MKNQVLQPHIHVHRARFFIAPPAVHGLWVKLQILAKENRCILRLSTIVLEAPRICSPINCNGDNEQKAPIYHVNNICTDTCADLISV